MVWISAEEATLSYGTTTFVTATQMVLWWEREDVDLLRETRFFVCIIYLLEASLCLIAHFQHP